MTLFDLETSKKVRDSGDSPYGRIKSNDASPSIFGYGFQIMVALIYSLENIKRLDRVVVEGSTEDIELYFNKQKPIFIQVKAKQKINSGTDKDNGKCNDAMYSLLNTSIKKRGNYEELIYVSNLPNPLALSKMEQDISWKPELDMPFEQNYTQLLDSSREFLDKSVEWAKKKLQSKNYNNTLKFFDRSKLFVTSIIYRDGEKENNQRVLKNKIQDFFPDIKFNSLKNITNFLFEYYFDNATMSQKLPKKQIYKKDLVWQLIVKFIDEKRIQPFTEDGELPIEIIDDFTAYKEENGFLARASRDPNNINFVLQSFFENNSKGTVAGQIKDFINHNWKSHADDLFPSENKLLQEYCTKEIMWEIICNYRVIKETKEKADMS